MRKSTKQTIKIDGAAYFLTLTVVNWVDVFTRPMYKDAIIDSLKYCRKEKGLNIYAYVIMTNHIHLLVNTRDPFLLKDTIRDFKKFTSKKISALIHESPESRKEWMMPIFAMNAALSKKHQEIKFWKAGNHAIETFSEKFIWDKIDYIHHNPVKAGFVREPQDWIYSSATNYYGMDSVLEVDCLPQRLVTVR
ncbi:MAG: transposase [Sphingobacteriaceae bacterium]|nr:transposase [Sphingobacteriaceae bacterium]